MKSKKKKSKRVVLIIVIVLAVVLIVLLASFLQNNYNYPIEYEDIVKSVSEKYDLDPALVFAVIYTESGFDSNAESGPGAQGLMQVMPETAEWISGKLNCYEYDLFNPRDNIEFGCWYLSYLLNRFSDADSAIAAYNAGQGNVDKWLENPLYSKDGVTLSDIPFDETSDYVDKVTKAYEKYKEII